MSNTNNTATPSRKAKWIKWGIGTFAALVVIGNLLPDEDSDAEAAKATSSEASKTAAPSPSKSSSEPKKTEKKTEKKKTSSKSKAEKFTVRTDEYAKNSYFVILDEISKDDPFTYAEADQEPLLTAMGSDACENMNALPKLTDNAIQRSVDKFAETQGMSGMQAASIYAAAIAENSLCPQIGDRLQ